MAVDAALQAKDVAFLLHPLVVGLGHALLDAGVAHGLERARKMMGVFLPQCADELAAFADVRLVPHGDVVPDEGLDVAHGRSMA
jgi:hypothetical protein